MRLVVTGSRGFAEPDEPFGPPDHIAENFLCSVLDGIWSNAVMGYMTVDMCGFTIIQGGCPTGADRIAKWWAENSPTHSYTEFPEDRSDVTKYPDQPPFDHIQKDADWDKYGKAAGPIRNGEMIDTLMDGDPKEERLVVGFVHLPLEDSRGTYNCIAQAQEAGVPNFVVRYYR